MHIVDVLVKSFWALFTWAMTAFAGAVVVMMADDPEWRRDSFVITWFCLMSITGFLSIFVACFT